VRSYCKSFPIGASRRHPVGISECVCSRHGELCGAGDFQLLLLSILLHSCPVSLPGTQHCDSAGSTNAEKRALTWSARTGMLQPILNADTVPWTFRVAWHLGYGSPSVRNGLQYLPSLSKTTPNYLGTSEVLSITITDTNAKSEPIGIIQARHKATAR
jgi:hypothetical protein